MVRHTARDQITGGDRSHGDQCIYCIEAEPSRPGPHNQQHADKPHPNGQDSAPANMLSKEQNRPQGHGQRQSLQHSGHIGQRHMQQCRKEEERRRQLGEAACGHQPFVTARKIQMQRAQVTGQKVNQKCRQRTANGHHLKQRHFFPGRLDQRIIDRKGRHTAHHQQCAFEVWGHFNLSQSNFNRRIRAIDLPSVNSSKKAKVHP